MTKVLKDVKWRKIHAPQPWSPTKLDEALVGFYLGRTKRDGKFGQYEVVIVAVPYKGTFIASGTALIQLVDAGMLVRGDAVRIVYKGKKELSSSTPDEPRHMKLFDLYIGETGAAEDLPEDKEHDVS